MRRVVVVSALAAVATACEAPPINGVNTPATTKQVATSSRHPAGATTLEGGVYVVMKGGDVKLSTGNTVYLLRESPALHTAIAAICARYGARLGHLDREYMAAELEAERLTRDVRTPASSARASNRKLSAISAEKVTLAAVTNDALENVLAQHEVAQSGTGVNGRYRFARLAPGSYRLYARTQIGDYPYTWWAQVEVARGDRAVKHLDNAVGTLTDGPRAGLCGPLPGSVPNTPAAPESTPTRGGRG